MAQLADLQQADGRLRYLVDDGVFDSNPCRVSCFLNPLYDLLPRNAWLVQQGVCQARPLHLSTPPYLSLCLPISPLHLPYICQARPLDLSTPRYLSLYLPRSPLHLPYICQARSDFLLDEATGTLCCPSPDNCCPNTARACQAQCTTDGRVTTCTSNATHYHGPRPSVLGALHHNLGLNDL